MKWKMVRRWNANGISDTHMKKCSILLITGGWESILLTFILAPVRMAVIKKTINTCISMYIATLFTVARKRSQSRFTSIGEWIRKNST